MIKIFQFSRKFYQKALHYFVNIVISPIKILLASALAFQFTISPRSLLPIKLKYVLKKGMRSVNMQLCPQSLILIDKVPTARCQPFIRRCCCCSGCLGIQGMQPSTVIQINQYHSWFRHFFVKLKGIKASKTQNFQNSRLQKSKIQYYQHKNFQNSKLPKNLPKIQKVKVPKIQGFKNSQHSKPPKIKTF